MSSLAHVCCACICVRQWICFICPSLCVDLLKLFGSACRTEPVEILSKFDRFTSYLLSALQSDVDSGVIGVAVETIGFIGSTTDGKHALEQLGHYHTSVCLLLVDLSVQILESQRN